MALVALIEHLEVVWGQSAPEIRVCRIFHFSSEVVCSSNQTVSPDNQMLRE